MNDYSSASTGDEASQNSSQKNLKISLYQKVAIFDWDDTLFCTKYLDALEINLLDLFSFKISLENNFSYLVTEFNELENVINIINFSVSLKLLKNYCKKVSKYLLYQMLI